MLLKMSIKIGIYDNANAEIITMNDEFFTIFPISPQKMS